MAATNLTKISVLVVDQHAQMRKIIATVLHGLGIRDIRHAADAEEAMESFATNPPDFIIANVEPRFKETIKLIYQLRDQNQSPNPFIRIIANSAEPTPSLLSAVRNAGVDEFFMKPFSARQLIARVSAIVDHPRPFVKTKSFFGPDRRRLKKTFDGTERRAEEIRKSAGDLDSSALLQKMQSA